MSLLNNFKTVTKTKTGTDKKTYGLTEVLGIMAMFSEGLKAQAVAELSGRSIHSIRYKFLEGVVTINGVTQQRSVCKYGTYEDLYKAHGVTKLPDDIESDVTDRIAEYKKSRLGEISQAS